MLDNFLNKLKEKYILICIFLLVFIMSYLAPYISDEYVYSFIFPKVVRPENFIDRVKNIQDVFKSTYLIYLKWSGRVLPNFFQTLFLFIGKMAFSLVNSIVFVKILENSKDLILKYEKRINFKNTDYIFLFSLIWFFIPVFFQDYIGLVSSINYSWMLLALVFYLSKIEDLTPKKQMFFSFIIGLTNESVVIFINLLLLYRLLIKKSKRINILSLACLWIGSAIQIFSPGNFSRKFHPASLQSTFSLIEKVKYFFLMEQTMLIVKVLSFLILLSFYLIKCQKKEIFIPKELIIISILSLSIMLSLIMPRNEPRAYLIPFYFLILSIFILLKSLLLKNNFLFIVKGILFVCLFLSLFKVLPRLYAAKNLDDERKYMITMYKNKNFKEGLFYDNTIGLSGLEFFYSTLEFVFLNPYSHTNIVFAKYYDFEKVYSIPRGNKLLIIEMKELKDFNDVIVLFDGERNNLRSQEDKEIFIPFPENTKEIKIEGKDFKIGKIRILEFYNGETLNIKGNITKINLEGNKK